MSLLPILSLVWYQKVMREGRLSKDSHRQARAQASLDAIARPKSTSGGLRIAKLVARAGLCSRREAEAWIAAGRIAVNGLALTGAAVNIKPGDMVTVDGKPLAPRARTRLFLFHKPRGLVTAARDPQGRPAVFDYLREHWPGGPRLVSVGRLDINSEGLLLLTNDGGLARVVELPSTGWVRRYRVRAKGLTSQRILDRLRQGITVEGVTYSGIEAVLDRVQGANCWLTVSLREGKNREVKRVLGSIGLAVNRLIRISFGPFQLGSIAEGQIEEVPTRVLRDQLGASLAKAAGADFASPPCPDGKPSGAGPAPLARVPPKGLRKARVETRFEKSAGPSSKDARTKPPPRRRKHISALRAAQSEEQKLRKRTQRGETADRSGRLIRVESLVPATGGEKTAGKPRARNPAKTAKGPAQGTKKWGGAKTPRERNEKTGSAGRPGQRGRSRSPRQPQRKR